MKAFLLAAGLGTRLRPLTDTVPKCMVPIRGKPLMEWWFELLERHGVTEVMVNTHYLSETVRSYMAQYNRRHTGLTAHEYYEPVLLGSGGTVKANREFIHRDEAFLICYADNLTNINLSAMLKFHQEKGAILTMALFHTNNPKGCGIVSLDSDQRIVEFTEKPSAPKSDLANAGVYMAGEALFEHFPQSAFCDFGKDVLPRLIGGMYGWNMQDYIIDIGTMENYALAQKEWEP